MNLLNHILLSNLQALNQRLYVRYSSAYYMINGCAVCFMIVFIDAILPTSYTLVIFASTKSTKSKKYPVQYCTLLGITTATRSA